MRFTKLQGAGNDFVLMQAGDGQRNWPSLSTAVCDRHYGIGATVAGQRHGYLGNKIDVKLPGGTLDVEWNDSGEVLLSGPTELVFNGEWPD